MKKSMLVMALLMFCVASAATAQQRARSLLEFPHNLVSEADRASLRSAATSALNNQPDGATSGWKNADTGTHGIFRPVKTYESDGHHCRRMQMRISAEGASKDWVFNFCRVEDSWKIAP